MLDLVIHPSPGVCQSQIGPCHDQLSSQLGPQAHFGPLELESDDPSDEDGLIGPHDSALPAGFRVVLFEAVSCVESCDPGCLP